MSKYALGQILFRESDYFGDSLYWVVDILPDPPEYKLLLIDQTDTNPYVSYPPDEVGEYFFKSIEAIDSSRYVSLAFDEADLTETITPSQHICVCTTFNVVNFGCKCGGV